MRFRVVLSGVALTILGVVVSPAAAASPAFPGTIRENLALATAPACTICHDNPGGGSGTATTAFAKYLRARGLQAGDVQSLAKALSAAAAERHDSDGDGTPDVEQLKAGRDPNVAEGDAAAIRDPAYGCGAHLAPTAASESTLRVLLLVSVGLASIRRRGSAHARRRR